MGVDGLHLVDLGVSERMVKGKSSEWVKWVDGLGWVG